MYLGYMKVSKQVFFLRVCSVGMNLGSHKKLVRQSLL